MFHRVKKFCRLRLGLKPVFDYVECRSQLLGVRDLAIRTVFDIGANMGKKARLYRKLFPRATIHCIEPLPACYERLHSWALGQQGKVQVFNLALGSRPGQTTLHWNLKHAGGSSLRAPSKAGPAEFARLRVEVETLDRLAARLDLADEIFVKIDVENFDMEVIRGGTDTLRRASAVIVEIPLPESPGEVPGFSEFVHTLDDLGYLYRGNLGCAYVDGIARNADAVFIKPPQARRAAA